MIIKNNSLKKTPIKYILKCEEYINQTSVESFLNCCDENEKKK